MALKQVIEERIIELERLLNFGKYEEAAQVIPNITKFISILNDEQRDFINAAKYAVNNNAEWK
jgi:hypothetical protein